MSTYVFTAKTFHWSEDGEVQILTVHCHEGDGSKLVIRCGKHQRKYVDKNPAVDPPAA